MPLEGVGLAPGFVVLVPGDDRAAVAELAAVELAHQVLIRGTIQAPGIDDEDDDFVVVLRLAQKPEEVGAEVEPLVVQVLAVDHTLRVPGDAAVDGGEVGFPVDPAAVTVAFEHAAPVLELGPRPDHVDEHDVPRPDVLPGRGRRGAVRSNGAGGGRGLEGVGDGFEVDPGPIPWRQWIGIGDLEDPLGQPGQELPVIILEPLEVHQGVKPVLEVRVAELAMAVLDIDGDHGRGVAGRWFPEDRQH